MSATVSDARIAPESSTTERVYDFIVKYISKNRYAPSIRDICQGTGLKSTSSVVIHLYHLDRDGRITLSDKNGGARQITLNGYVLVPKAEYEEMRALRQDQNHAVTA